MLKWAIGILIDLVWMLAKDLGRDLAAWIDEASNLGLKDRAAFEHVWKCAKSKYSDIGDWALNFLIEAVVGKKAKDKAGGILTKLKLPSKLTKKLGL